MEWLKNGLLFSGGNGGEDAAKLCALNEKTSAYGLTLTPQEAAGLVQVKSESLRASGRVEFGESILPALVEAFSDSPYLHTRNYAETLCSLTELFYAFKNETLDGMSDRELLDRMKTAFDGSCGGSLELLTERELTRMARELRGGEAEELKQEEKEDDGDDDA